MAKEKANKKSRLFLSGKLDLTLLFIVLILLTIGLVMLFSASYVYSYEYKNHNSYQFILKQSFFAAIGLVAMFAFSKFDYHKLRKFSWLLYGVTLVLLALLLIMPPISDKTDAKRWIVIASVNFQPSELAKFSIILLFSSLIAANQKKMGNIKFVFFLLFLLGVFCALIAFEPHISATVLILMIGITIMFIGGLPKRYIMGGAFAGAAGVAFLIITKKISYGSDRITYWLDPWKDPTGKGFQTIQSLLAIGSGGVLGRGIGQSRQKHLWVPEPQNDFIFSIVCEELGLIGAFAIIALFALLIWRGFVIAMRSPDKFGSMLAIGITFQIGLQAMLNIFVVTNTLPNTGISLPFFSYGGTSLVVLLAEMGIVLSVSRTANIEKT
ncbi:MAG: putative lipid II flippase FtsW [Clostridia bacterium]|nr:putative lipid II flippase FtsW [Clostridia bacterium]